MTVLFHYAVADFSRLAKPFLTQNEALENLTLGMLLRFESDPPPPDTILATVHDSKSSVLVSCAVQQPGRSLVLSRCRAEGIRSLALALVKREISLPGAIGPAAEAAEFASAWSEFTGLSAKRAMRQAIYAVSTVRDAPSARGTWRAAGGTEAPLIAAWTREFVLESLPHEADSIPGLQSAMESAIADGRLFVWELDGRPVSMAAVTGRTPNGIRIIGVYTPRSLRGNGFATALVAAISRLMLERGLKSCYLFTDLGNPVSNRIYQSVGYEHVADTSVYLFS